MCESVFCDDCTLVRIDVLLFILRGKISSCCCIILVVGMGGNKVPSSSYYLSIQDLSDPLQDKRRRNYRYFIFYFASFSNHVPTCFLKKKNSTSIN